MEHLKRLSLALLVTLAMPVVAQEEEGNAFFSLSSDRTFGPDEKPAVQLWGQGFKQLEFRLYRVNDPVVFFQKLEDDHNFGGRAPQRQGKLTPLERLREWKQRQRLALRDLVRAQFTMDARREYVQNREEAAAKKKGGKPAVSEFAGVPILNPQQLVAKWNQPFQPANRWESAQVELPVKGKGLYLVEATDNKLSAYTIVSVTNLAIISKGAPGRLLMRAVQRGDGAPVAGVPVKVFDSSRDQKRDQLGTGETDKNGFAEIKMDVEKPESLLILARHGEDFAALSTYGGNVSTDEDNRLQGYVYTDRPVYRPGHSVYYKAIVRAREIEAYKIPSNRDVAVEVQDNEGKSVYKAQQSLSSMGTVSGKFVLPASASLGFYSVQMRIGDSYQSGGFQVEEYKKPEYEVKVTPAPKRVLQGDTVKAEIEARYYYGEPVAGAKVTWVVHRSRYWLPYFMDDLDDAESGNGGEFDSPYAQKEQILEKSGELDAEGKLTITLPTEVYKDDQRYRIEARVTDAAGREISGSGFVVATVGPYFVHITAERYIYSPGEQAAFKIEARDYDNQPVSNAPFTVDVLQWRWRDGEGNVLNQAQGTTGADGTARVTLPVSSGSLRARVRSNTRQGREVSDYEYVWVSGEASWMASSTEQRIQIVTDKKKYAPGENVKLMVMAGEPGMHLWVTVEGRSVLASHFVTAKDGTASIEVPVKGSYAPNFWVTAVAMRHNKLIQGTKSVKVPPLENQLSVDIKPSKAEFKPGEPANYLMEVKDHAGKPVRDAEFSVGVVDEALYGVRPDTTPDILTSFYGREWNRVNTESSLSYYFHGEAGKRRMQLARIRPFRPNAQLKPDKMVQPKVRRAFPDTAFWSAEVRTDSAGKATVKLEFPDALTTWRATARGVTADTKVGSAVNRVIVRKNLLTRLAIPRFFRQGDTITLKVITQNLLPRDKQVQVSLETKGLEILDAKQMSVSIPTKGTHVADFRVKVPVGSEAVILAKALTDEESDAMEMTLPIVPFGVKMADSRGGSLSGSTTETKAEVTIPQEAEPNSAALELSATPSVAGSLFDALEYLTAFPYGCTEQTMSSFLPNVVVSQAVKSLGLPGRVNEPLLAKKVKAGMERLLDFQHDDGGWGWWKTDDSDLFMTAYVVAGLSQGKAAGHPIEYDNIKKGADWLRKSGEKLKKAPLDLQAYSEYALALAGVPALQLDDLVKRKGEMNGYALALLGLALDSRKDDRAAAIAAELESKVKSTELEAWWSSSHDYLLDVSNDVTPEATAYAVKLLAHRNPQSPLLPKAALYLVNHRSEGYYWSSTKQTAMVIFGLTDYLKSSGELKPNLSVSVYVNDKEVISKRFNEADATVPATIKLKASQLQPGVNRIRVVRSGEGRVYWSARSEYYSNSPRIAKRGNLQLNVDRTYYKLVSTQQGQKIVYNLEPFSGNAAQGDVLAVKLDVTGNEWKYLLIEDPIPAGTEIIERDDLYEISQRPAWWRYWFSRREFRDDRAAFFQTYFGSNRQYFYLLKVINPGQFRVSPARVEPMYQPQYFATSDAMNLEVKQ